MECPKHDLKLIHVLKLERAAEEGDAESIEKEQ